MPNGMPGMPQPPAGFSPLNWQSMPGAGEVYGRPTNDPQRRVCEGNGGHYMDVRPPQMHNMPGAVVDIPVQAYCEIDGRQSMYDRGSWSPPLTSLSGLGADASSGSGTILILALAVAMAWVLID